MKHFTFTDSKGDKRVVVAEKMATAEIPDPTGRERCLHELRFFANGETVAATTDWTQVEFDITEWEELSA